MSLYKFPSTSSLERTCKNISVYFFFIESLTALASLLSLLAPFTSRLGVIWQIGNRNDGHLRRNGYSPLIYRLRHCCDQRFTSLSALHVEDTQALVLLLTFFESTYELNKWCGYLYSLCAASDDLRSRSAGSFKLWMLVRLLNLIDSVLNATLALQAIKCFNHCLCRFRCARRISTCNKSTIGDVERIPHASWPNVCMN
jgi:hypothetical protein